MRASKPVTENPVPIKKDGGVEWYLKRNTVSLHWEEDSVILFKSIMSI